MAIEWSINQFYCNLLSKSFFYIFLTLANYILPKLRDFWSQLVSRPKHKNIVFHLCGNSAVVINQIVSVRACVRAGVCAGVCACVRVCHCARVCVSLGVLFCGMRKGVAVML